MRIPDLLGGSAEPCFSFEFFPPKTDEGVAELFASIEDLNRLEPTFVSVTYGAAGSTREGTVEVTTRIKRDYGIETMAHLSVVGETIEGLDAILDRLADAGIENILALRGDPPRGEADFTPPPGGCAAPPSWRRSSAAASPPRASGSAPRASRRSTPRPPPPKPTSPSCARRSRPAPSS